MLLLLSAPAVPAGVVVLRLLSVLPLPVGRLVVTTNVVLLPLGLGWLALGWLLRSAPGEPTASRSSRR